MPRSVRNTQRGVHRPSPEDLERIRLAQLLDDVSGSPQLGPETALTGDLLFFIQDSPNSFWHPTESFLKWDGIRELIIAPATIDEPSLRWIDNNGAADNKAWRAIVDDAGLTWSLQAVLDDDSFAGDAFTVTRSFASITAVNMIAQLDITATSQIRCFDDRAIHFGDGFDINLHWDSVASELQVESAAGDPQWVFRNGMHVMLTALGNVNTVDFHHDITDLNTVAVNTTDWNITGLTGGIVLGTGVDITSDFHRTIAAASGGLEANNLLTGVGFERVLTTADIATGGASLAAAYRFDTSIVEADPGNGDFRMDNATPASVTELFISSTTDNGNDFNTVLSLVGVGDQIYIQQDNDAAKFILFDVTANVDNTGWWSMAGTIAASGTIFDGNAKCHILILLGGSGAFGDVFKVGTPLDNQIGVWTGDGTIEGTPGLTYDGTDLHTTADVYVASDLVGKFLQVQGQYGSVMVNGQSTFATAGGLVGYSIGDAADQGAFGMLYHDTAARGGFFDLALNQWFIQSFSGSNTYLYYNGVFKAFTINTGFQVVGDVLATSFGGITQANLVDKSATEAIAGAWTFNGDVVTTADIHFQGTVTWEDSAFEEFNPGPTGNFGQFQAWGTETDFNAEPDFWGWTFVQGTTNGPPTTSSGTTSWFRQKVAMGLFGKGFDPGDYNIEMAMPRTITNGAEMWVRRTVNGTPTAWTQMGARLDSLLVLGIATVEGIATFESDVIVEGTFTSLGIDDNATTEVMEIADTTLSIGQNDANSYGIRRKTDTGLLILSGGSTGDNGAAIWFYGGLMATNPGDMLLQSDGEIWQEWDEAGGIWNLYTGNGVKTLALSVAANQIATFASAVIAPIATISAAIPILNIIETDAGVDQGKSQIFQNGETFFAQIVDDTTLNAYQWLQIERSGTGASVQVDTLDLFAVDDITLNSALVNVTGILAPVSYTQLPVFTDAALNAIANAVNTDAGKIQGAMVYNSSQDIPVYAVGSADGSVWVDGAGTTVNTPV